MGGGRRRMNRRAAWYDARRMADREQLAQVAEQFRASGLLGKPGTLSRLFDFLLARTLAGDAPKEIEIALEVFGKAPTFDVSQDAVVRVYVHKLRRRLEDFHAKSADPSIGKLAIPKGEYRIVLEPPPVQASAFVPSAPAVLEPSRARAWMWAALALAIGLVIGSVVALLVSRSAIDPGLRTVRASAIWAPLLADDVPVTIVVGDYYLLGENDPNGGVRRLVREFNINSHTEFLEYAELDPELTQKYRNLNLTYLPTSSAFVVQDIAPILGRRKRVNVTLMSNFDVSLLKSTHVIYVGFFSGLGLLGDPVFAASRVSPGGSFDELVDRTTNTTYLSTAMPLQGGDSSYRDYAYFSTFEGPAGHRVLVIAGTRDSGVRQMGEILSQSRTLDELAKQAGAQANGQAQFESLYEVYGVAQASIKAKLLFASPMRDVNVWMPPIKETASTYSPSPAISGGGLGVGASVHAADFRSPK